MTQYKIFTPEWNSGVVRQINRSSIGFDRLFNDMASRLNAMASNAGENYPPYDILKVSDDHYMITLAVAGFSQDDLDVEVVKQTLVVTGKSNERTLPENAAYVHKGIGNRAFKRTFSLAEHVEVDGMATVENGILTVNLKHIVPEEKKPKRVAISFKN